MRKNASIWLLLLAGFALGCATAQPAPSNLSPDEARIDRLLRLRELPRYLAKLEEVSLHVAGTPRDDGFPESERLRPRIEQELAPYAVMADVVHRVAQHFDSQYVGDLEHFDASALADKVHKAAATPYSWWSRLGYRLFGGFSDDSPERVALVRRLDELTRTRETTVDLYLRIHSSIVRWYQSKGFIDPKESEAVGGIHGLLTSEREKAEAASNRHAIPFMLYAYSDLSQEELKEYVDHAASPAGQWFAGAVRQALIDSIAQRGEAIAR